MLRFVLVIQIESLECNALIRAEGVHLYFVHRTNKKLPVNYLFSLRSDSHLMLTTSECNCYNEFQLRHLVSIRNREQVLGRDFSKKSFGGKLAPLS